MKCNASRCNELVFQRKRHSDEMSNIQECSEFTVSGLNFQQDCGFVKLLKASLVKQINVYVIRSVEKEGCGQLEVDYLFKTIVLPNVT